MCPKQAEIIVIEDDPIFREWLIRDLEKSGHSVVGVATNRLDAEELIRRIPEWDAKKLVITLDANLSRGDSSGKDGDGLLGQTKAYEGVKVVGITGTRGGIEGADLNVSKDDIGFGGVDISAKIDEL